MEQKPRSAQSVEGAILTVKIDGMLRLVAIVSAFTFWYSVAIVLFLLHVAGILPLSSTLSAAQVASAVGLAPIPVALATWKAFEWAYAIFLTAYAKKHYQP